MTCDNVCDETETDEVLRVEWCGGSTMDHGAIQLMQLTTELSPSHNDFNATTETTETQQEDDSEENPDLECILL